MWSTQTEQREPVETGPEFVFDDAIPGRNSALSSDREIDPELCVKWFIRADFAEPVEPRVVC